MDGILNDKGYQDVGADAAATHLNNAVAMLFTDAIIPSKATVAGDLHDATFHGYARQTGITWVAGLHDEEGNNPIISSGCSFIATAPLAGPEIITGIALFDTTGLILLGLLLFDNPITIDHVGDFVLGTFGFTPDNGVLRFHHA